jgi:hypothetical protein
MRVVLKAKELVLTAKESMLRRGMGNMRNTAKGINEANPEAY